MGGLDFYFAFEGKSFSRTNSVSISGVFSFMSEESRSSKLIFFFWLAKEGSKLILFLIYCYVTSGLLEFIIKFEFKSNKITATI